MESEQKTIQKHLLITIAILSVFGLIMVFDGSLGLYAYKYHYIKLQAIWVLIGGALCYLMYRIDYKLLQKYAKFLMVAIIVMLVIVIGLSHKVNGSARWINLLGFVNFQPSEFAKIIFIIYLSAWIVKMQPIISQVKSYKENLVKYLLPFIAITLIITILVVLEKDFGSTIIIASIAIALFFISNTNVYSKINFITIGVIFFVLGLISIVIEPYRFQRLLTFLNNSGTNKQLSSGYQVHQILIAIGSGGIFGVGFTQSIQKNQYLVGNTSITDSIFAVIAEELGLIGSIAIIAIYVYLVWQIYKIALRVEDPFGKFVAAGIGTWIIVQVFVNISANIGLIPLTGITLPFISYGGSSIISILIGMGIVLSINKSEK